MSVPKRGYVPAHYLTPLEGSEPTVLAELNTAKAYARLRAAHPQARVSGAAAGYWSHQLDVAVHANPGKYNVVDKALAPIGSSLHLLGMRINFHGISERVAAGFGFRAFNTYTFDYTGTPAWDQAALVPPKVKPTPVTPTPPPILPPATITPPPTIKPTPEPIYTPPPTVKAPPVSTPTPAQLKADVAALQTDSDQLASGLPAAPLAGILAGHTSTRRRAYIIYAGVALVISFGPDIVTANILSAHADAVLVATVGIASSVILKIGVAFGFVAASNAKE